jgi:hypothetical protein
MRIFTSSGLIGVKSERYGYFLGICIENDELWFVNHCQIRVRCSLIFCYTVVNEKDEWSISNEIRKIIRSYCAFQQ